MRKPSVKCALLAATIGDAVDLPTLRPGRGDNVHRLRDLFGQPVMAEGTVVADVHRFSGVRGDEILVRRIQTLLTGRERDDVSTGEQSVQPSFLGEPGGDLSGGVRDDF